MGKRQSQAAQASMLETPERYVWDSPGHEVRIVVEREAAEQLREAARNGAPGGLLLGDSTDEPSRVVTVRALAPLAWSLGMDEEERGRFEDAVTGATTHGRAVGYFRVQTDQDLFLNASDLVLMKSFFPEPACVFLLLEGKASGDPGTRFFFWDGGLLRPGWTSAGMPFGYPLAVGEESAAVPVPESDPLPMPVCTDANWRGRLHRFVWIAAVLLLGGGVVAALGGYTSVIGKARAWLASSPAPGAPQPFTLDVEKKLGDLVLTWDRSSPPLRSAVRAVLFIRDGAAERSYDVDLTQLATGTVYYTPQTGDVQFRLEVYGANEALAVASARVLSAALPPPLPLAPPSEPALPAPDMAAARQPTRQAMAGQEPERSAARPLDLASPHPAAARPHLQALDAPPLLAGGNPRTPLPSAVMPRGVRVDAPAPESPEAAPAPAPQPTAARASDYVGPRATRQVSPSVPSNVRAMLKSETSVEVKVGINESGRVDQAAVVNQRGGMASYLAETALRTARLWRFEPARDNGRAVRSEMILNFRFTQ